MTNDLIERLKIVADVLEGHGHLTDRDYVGQAITALSPVLPDEVDQAIAYAESMNAFFIRDIVARLARSNQRLNAECQMHEQRIDELEDEAAEYDLRVEHLEAALAEIEMMRPECGAAMQQVARKAMAGE